MGSERGQRQPDPNDPFADEPEDEGSKDEPQGNAAATDGGDEGSRKSNDDPADLREKLRNQRRVNSQLATRVRELEGKQAAAGTVEERATNAERDRDRLAQELREERAIRSIMAQATRAGAVDPEDVADLMLRRNLIEFDSEGKPVEIAQAVEDLRSEKPHLFAAATGSPRPRVPDADAGRGNGRDRSEQKPDWNAAFRRVAGSTRQR